MKGKNIIKRLFIFLFGIGILVALLFVGINIYVRLTTIDDIITIEEAVKLDDVDCILVLGASVTPDDQPSVMLEDRLKTGIELYKAGCCSKLLMSGDHGGLYYDEVNIMKDYAKEAGVPSGDIFMDHAGFSTYESMYRAKKIFDAEKVVIVTQKYHLPRALHIAKSMGIEAYGVACEDIRYAGQTMRDIREFLAIGKDFFNSIIKPKPTLMGGKIDLRGSGDVTNDTHPNK